MFYSWLYVSNPSVRKSIFWYRYYINSDNKRKECKRKNRDNSAGVPFLKSNSLVSFKVVLGMSLVSSKNAIITQPLFPLKTSNYYWYMGYFCMGNMQKNKGFCFALLGLIPTHRYIAYSFTLSQSPLLHYSQTLAFLVLNLSLFIKMALTNWVPPFWYS